MSSGWRVQPGRVSQWDADRQAPFCKHLCNSDKRTCGRVWCTTRSARPHRAASCGTDPSHPSLLVRYARCVICIISSSLYVHTIKQSNSLLDLILSSKPAGQICQVCHLFASLARDIVHTQDQTEQLPVGLNPLIQACWSGIPGGPSATFLAQNTWMHKCSSCNENSVRIFCLSGCLTCMQFCYMLNLPASILTGVACICTLTWTCCSYPLILLAHTVFVSVLNIPCMQACKLTQNITFSRWQCLFTQKCLPLHTKHHFFSLTMLVHTKVPPTSNANLSAYTD